VDISEGRHLGDGGTLRVSTAGSVDDGKSTLIGRLLVDTRGVYEDQLAAARAANERRGGRGVDLALITDGLRAEREQGITIDVAHRYFSTPRRKFIIADTPGHEQYTRNMVTGASTADAAVVLVDARKGILPQSRRHAVIAALLGIPHLIVAVNKMDLVNFERAVFERIRADVEAFAARLPAPRPRIHYIPLSALDGDMVVERGARLPWYDGDTLLGTLEALPTSEQRAAQAFRFPVQNVTRPQTPGWHDFRGNAGRVESGVVRIGDEVVVLPSGQTARIERILTFDGDRTEAFAPQSVTLVLDAHVDVSRGDILAHRDAAPTPARAIEADLCWMADAPLNVGATYLLRHGTRTVKAMISRLRSRLDVQTLVPDEAPPALALNDIGRASLTLRTPIAHDAYRDHRATGSFILIDEATNGTVAAGMIRV
jgi:sulfate adenylyltransferase subunit 1